MTRAESAIRASSKRRSEHRSPTVGTRTQRTSTTELHVSDSVTEDQIRVRAYYLSLERVGHVREIPGLGAA